MEVITTHINADFDALSSMLAAKLLYPDATLVFPGATERNVRNFYVESVVYAYGFEKLKNIDLDQVTRLILVDTRQSSRIGKFKDLIGRPGVEVHIYDHHPPSDEDVSGDLEYIKKLGANTTQMVRIIREKNIPIPEDLATILALGIYEDTGSFTFVSTSEEDFIAAGYLVTQGANLNMIADMMHRELTAEQLALLNELVQSAQKMTVQGIEIVIGKVSTDNYVGDFAVLAHKFMDMEHLNVLFALALMAERIYVVGRSRLTEVDVSEILTVFGGGGHPSAASASIKGKTLFQVERELVRVLHAKIKPQLTASDIMSYPVISVKPTQSLAEVGETLTRYNINVALVMDGPALLGHISRQIVEKASYHGLKELPASEYMSSEFTTVSPDTPIEEAQRRLIEHKQRVLPVTEGQNVVGVITRTDLLNVLMDEPPLTTHPFERLEESGYVRSKNVSSLLRERLPRNLIELLKDFGAISDDLGYSAYAVGGFIRDLFLRRPNMDIDIVIEGSGIEFARKYAGANEGVRIRTHEKFGTAVIILPDGFKVDVATARREYYESPATLPIVELSSLKLDLYRRDFSINTLAVKLNQRHFGMLIDFFGAQKDLKDRAIRVLHNLSFVEDPTRVFRAIRFETRFGFRIGKLTEGLIRNAVKINVFEKLAGRRLAGELRLLLEDERPLLSVKRMDGFELLEVIHPSIQFNKQMEELFDALDGVISWYELSFLEEKIRRWMVFFLGLTHNLSGAELDILLRRLETPKKERLEFVNARRAAQHCLQTLNAHPRITNGEIYDLFVHLDNETLLFMMAKTRNEVVKKAISLYFTQLRSVAISTKGRDLKKMGFVPGPIFRAILDDVFHAKLNGLTRSRKEELAYIHERYPDPSSAIPKAAEAGKQAAS